MGDTVTAPWNLMIPACAAERKQKVCAAKKKPLKVNEIGNMA